MPWCNTCGQKASPEIHKMLEESNYNGDYFCNDECREKQRSRENFGRY